MAVRVDLERKASIPHHQHIAVVGYRLDHPAVADHELVRTVGDAEQLDPGAHANACTYAGCEKAGTMRIHVGCIGWSGRNLYGKKQSHAGATS